MGRKCLMISRPVNSVLKLFPGMGTLHGWESFGDGIHASPRCYEGSQTLAEVF
jgi:hypothetical protein